jgi:putative ABC transport system ATP-binding protein
MIELKNVKKVYQSGSVYVEALRDINLKIDKGEMVVLGGVSGSGKSTLLNLLGGMDKPTSGSINIDGEDTTNYSPRELTSFRARKVGFIFQSFNLIPVLNVFENIVVPMRLKRQKFEKKDVLELIERVGLIDHIRHKPDELSGGQRQRVAIARALAHNPPYIMADEPTANLDSKTSANIVDLLKELNKNLHVTIIFASHDQWVLDNIDRKILLKDGGVE